LLLFWILRHKFKCQLSLFYTKIQRLGSVFCSHLHAKCGCNSTSPWLTLIHSCGSVRLNYLSAYRTENTATVVTVAIMVLLASVWHQIWQNLLHKTNSGHLNIWVHVGWGVWGTTLTQNLWSLSYFVHLVDFLFKNATLYSSLPACDTACEWLERVVYIKYIVLLKTEALCVHKIR
jgi:hypothetical protein